MLAVLQFGVCILQSVHLKGGCVITLRKGLGQECYGDATGKSQRNLPDDWRNARHPSDRELSQRAAWWLEVP